MVSKKVMRWIVNNINSIPGKFSKIRALSKFDFSRVFEFAVKEVMDAKKAGREPDPSNVSKFAPDMNEDVIREFISFSSALSSCWEKHGDNVDEILKCLET